MDDEEEEREGLAGLAVEEAVEVVLDRGDADDPEAARARLERVAEDGVVRQSAARSALADVSKVVATPETRLEVAADALDSARETAAPVADLGAVRARIEEYESRLATVEAAVEDLGADLQRLVEDRGGDGGLYELAAGIERLAEDANEVHREADELYAEAEQFERWLTTPERRYEELDGDLDALDDALADLEAAVDELAAAVEGRPDAPEADAETVALTWTDASFRHRVLGLLLADVDAELAELRAWPDDGPGDGDGADAAADGIGSRLEALEDHRAAIGDRLADLAGPAATDDHERRLAEFEDALDGYEPPVRWDEVQGELQARLSELEDAG